MGDNDVFWPAVNDNDNDKKQQKRLVDDAKNKERPGKLFDLPFEEYNDVRMDVNRALRQIKDLMPECIRRQLFGTIVFLQEAIDGELEKALCDGDMFEGEKFVKLLDSGYFFALKDLLVRINGMWMELVVDKKH